MREAKWSSDAVLQPEPNQAFANFFVGGDRSWPLALLVQHRPLPGREAHHFGPGTFKVLLAGDLVGSCCVV